MRIIKAAAIFVLTGTAAQADGYGFRTPSANIYCNGSIDGGDISCTIVERSSAPVTPKPASCRGSWGHTFNLERGGMPTIDCDTRTLKKSRYSAVLGYGETAELGENTCRSETTGLTCRNAKGHGFSLSRRSRKVF